MNMTNGKNEVTPLHSACFRFQAMTHSFGLLPFIPQCWKSLVRDLCPTSCSKSISHDDDNVRYLG